MAVKEKVPSGSTRLSILDPLSITGTNAIQTSLPGSGATVPERLRSRTGGEMLPNGSAMRALTIG